MRDTDGLQTTLTLGPVNCRGPTLSVELGLRMTRPMPAHDPHLPDRIEALVHQAGLEVQRRLFRALIEEADQESVLSRRHGKAGAGIQRRGTRPFTFKTIFGEVTVGRSRISHKHDGTIEVPSATARDTPHQLAITADLRDAVCDRMGDRSAGRSRVEVCREAGGEDLLGRSTTLEVVRREGERSIAARRERARATPGDASEAQRASLGPAATDAVAGGLGDDPPCDDVEEPEPAEWAPTGSPGAEPAFPVAADERREVDRGFVIVEPDEVKAEAQPTTGREAVWTYTAVVPVAGWR